MLFCTIYIIYHVIYDIYIIISIIYHMLFILCYILYIYTLPETNMAMEHRPFEDLFPIENGDFSLPC